MLFMTIGEQIKAARGVESQRSLAARAGMEPAQLSRIESGAFNPRWDTLQKLSTALGVVLGAEPGATQVAPKSQG